MNRFLVDETEYVTPDGMEGMNLSLTNLQQPVIKPAQDAGKTVGIWYVADVATENDEMYEVVFGKTGQKVDLFYSDHPLAAMKARDRLQPN